MAIASLRVPISALPTPDRSWLTGLQTTLGDAIDKKSQNISFGKLADQISGTSQPAQPATSGFLGSLSGRPAAAVAAPAPVQGNTAVGTPNDIQNQFIGTVRSGGVNNPYALAAIAATGRAESSFSPSKVNASWPDPSQSGQAGTAGGILSWRNERLANLRNFAQSQGEDPSNISPATQAKFFLQEDPNLVQRLNAAKSPQEAASLMANAWKFAGYDQPGGEAARRAALAQNYYSQQFANAQPPQAAPTQVASLDPTAGMPTGSIAPTAAPQATAPGFDPSTVTPDQMQQLLGPAPTRGYVDPQVVNVGNQQAQAGIPPQVGGNPAVAATQSAPAASAPPMAVPQAATAPQGLQPSAAGMIAAAQPASRQTVSSQQIADLVRDPNTRQVGLQLWQQVQTGKTAEPWQFITLPDGTLARANQATGAIEGVGQFQKPKAALQNVAKGAALYDENSGQWITPPAGAGGENPDNYFGTVIKGYDKDGNPVYLQPGKDGTANRVPLPADFKPENRYEKIDLGTSWLIKDTTNGTSQEVPKDVAGENKEKAVGTAAGQAQSALPAVEGAANQMLSSIDSLANDPYLPNMLGKKSYLPNVSTESQRVQSRMDQITGQSFLQAYNTLRGGGQITEVEGAKATAAMARLNTAQNEKDYRDALNDLRSVVQNAVQRARQQAGQSSTQQPSGTSGNQTSSGVKWSIEK
jgi:hypothetical protein